MGTVPSEGFEFEGFVLDLSRGCLKAPDGDIELRPKSYELLRTLVQNQGRLLAREELLSTVWPNATVTEEALTHCISELRHALRDREQKIIKTIPKRGYLFASTAKRTTSAEARSIQESRHPYEATGGAFDQTAEFLRDRASIAVVPFANITEDPAQEYVSDGITEDIITELSRFSELLVIAGNSSSQYKTRAMNARQVGRELGVRYVLEGSVRQTCGRIRITAQLVDASSGVHCWADSYDRELEDLFAVLDEVVSTISGMLASQLNRLEAQRTRARRASTWQAHDYYLRGVDAFWKHQSTPTREAIQEGRRLLEQSLALDPDNARAYAALAYTFVKTYLEPFDEDYLSRAALARAYEFAKKAVQLDPNSPLAYTSLGWTLVFKKQHEASIAAFERARHLNRNLRPHHFGMVLVFAGQSARAVEYLKAVEQVDPYAPASRCGFLGNAYYILGQYADAVPELRECTLRAPNVRIGHLWLAAAYSQLGQLDEARAAAAEVLRLEPDFTIARWKSTAVYRRPVDAEHLLEGVRKAGLPER